MSRSAADATRFTATGPYASSKFAASSIASARSKASAASQLGPKHGPPETPKQKVERLRAQARAARMAQSSSPVDRLIERGRVWADRAHLATVYTLLAASGIAGALTIYSITSLVMYNRRQRQLWVDRQLDTLMEAKKAYVAGTATPEQLKILENEKIGEEEKRMKEELKKQNFWYKGKQWLTGGLKTDEGAVAAVPATETPLDQQPKVLEAIQAKALEDQNKVQTATSPAAGPLDVMADNAETAVKETKRTWMSWLTGR